MIDTPRISRRAFIVAGAAVGGGLAIGINPFSSAAAVRAADGSLEITVWVVIRPNETVVVRIARSEMGQGSLTGLAQLAAEELECNWNRVTWEYPTPGTSLARKKPWGPFGTGGSDSIRGSQEYVRKGGAAARMMLVQAAANRWNVPAGECTVEKGVISHNASGRRTTYGSVAEAAAKLDVPKEVPLKDPKDWKIIGKPMKRLDTADKLTGKQTYGADIKLPGMLNASIKACPVFGGKVKSIDATTADGMPGVKRIVRVGDSAVAVVADTWWHANTALEALRIEWDAGESAAVSSTSIDAMLNGGAERGKGVRSDNKVGDSKAALAGAAKRIEAIYDYPYQNHACMEPMNCYGALHARTLRGVVPDANRPRGDRRSRDGGRSACQPMRRPQGSPGRRLRPARVHGLCDAGRADCEGDAGNAGQAALVARGRHDARALSPGYESEADGRSRYQRQSTQEWQSAFRGRRFCRRWTRRSWTRTARTREYSRPVSHREKSRSSTAFQNLTIDHAMRNTHVPPGVLAWRDHQSQRDLSRMFHRRARACCRAGCSGISTQANGHPSEGACSARCRREKRWLGQEGAPAGIVDWRTSRREAVTWRRWPRFRSETATGSGFTGSCWRSIPATQ